MNKPTLIFGDYQQVNKTKPNSLKLPTSEQTYPNLWNYQQVNKPTLIFEDYQQVNKPTLIFEITNKWTNLP